jgi:hypothetical protein
MLLTLDSILGIGDHRGTRRMWLGPLVVRCDHLRVSSAAVRNTEGAVRCAGCARRVGDDARWTMSGVPAYGSLQVLRCCGDI